MQVKHLTDERAMLECVEHPFLVQMSGTFQDKECVYIVLEFVSGGEFFTLLRNNGR